MITWSERIDQAERRDHAPYRALIRWVVPVFTFRDRRDAREWETCAVGESFPDGDLDAVLNGDPELKRLGLAFDDAVKGGNPRRARVLYRQIQKRAREHQADQVLSEALATTDQHA